MADSSTISPGRPRYSAIELLGALLLVLLLAPFLEELPHGNIIEVALIALVFVSAAFAVECSRAARHSIIAIAAVTIVARSLEHLLGSSFPNWIFPPFTLAFLAAIFGLLIRSIVKAPRVDASVLCAAIAAFLIMGFFWSVTYLLVDAVTPGAFATPATAAGIRTLQRFDAFYFSFISLTTVGYGDITPLTKPARMLSVMEAMSGTFYMAVLISRLVSLYSSLPRSTDQK